MRIKFDASALQRAGVTGLIEGQCVLVRVTEGRKGPEAVSDVRLIRNRRRAGRFRPAWPVQRSKERLNNSAGVASSHFSPILPASRGHCCTSAAALSASFSRVWRTQTAPSGPHAASNVIPGAASSG